MLMPSGCRMGICFGCVLPLRAGSVRDLRTGELTTATPGETVDRRDPGPDLHLRGRRRLRASTTDLDSDLTRTPD